MNLDVSNACRWAVVLLSAISGWSPMACHADWPMYRNDAQRSGYTAEKLSTPLAEAWHLKPPSQPQPAWPRSDRQTFDWSPQPIIVDKRCYFGDSVSGELSAVDTQTGQLLWSYSTAGPIRFAPAVDGDTVFVCSDDGCLHAVDRKTGLARWRHQGGPDHSKRLGNQRMISRWPARGGPVVMDGKLFYAAGIWPTDGIYLYALDAKTGKVVWANDNAGQIYMPQPHGGAEAESGVSAQGHLLATNSLITAPIAVSGADRTASDTGGSSTGGENNSSATRRAAGEKLPEPNALASGSSESVDSAIGSQDSKSIAAGLPITEKHWLLVPTGRAVPAAFDRDTGQFEYFHLQKYGQKGGAVAQANDRFMINSGMIFDINSGQALHTIGNSPIALIPGGMVAMVDKQLTYYQWGQVDQVDRKGATEKVIAPVPQWSIAGVELPTEIIVADQTIILGGNNRVSAVDCQSQQVVWQAPVDGKALSLAVDGGRLIVGTDTGSIHCFASPAVVSPSAEPQVLARSPIAEELSPAIMAYAKKIVELSKQTSGYCLDFGCGDGQLAVALSRISDLHIIAIESDQRAIELCRERLLRNGLLGSRVHQLHEDDFADTGLPDYFANLIVSSRSMVEGPSCLPAIEVARLTRPYGGVSLLGSIDELKMELRGPLPGARQWTHQYATAGNSTCSTDEHIQGELGMLWFRDLDVSMPQRHGRGPGPLFLDGRLYSMGMHELVCVDAYNGQLLWRYSLPNILAAYNGDELMGTAGTNSVYCVANSGVYVRYGQQCFRIDRATGELLATFDAPVDIQNQPGIWGYIACVEGVLLGSLADANHVVTFRYLNRGGDMSSLLTESKTLFGMDALSGDILWRYDASESIRHNAIAVDGQAVYLIDRIQAVEDRTKDAKIAQHAGGTLVALDLKTGLQKWKNDQQIDGTLLALSDQHSVLLMSTQPTRFSLESEKAAHLAAFDQATGQLLWLQPAKYSTRPMINGRTIYAEGGSWDLLSGSPQPFEFKRSYGCGQLAGSKHGMLFRSATLGYFDFERQEKVENYGGVRPGCWINAIPAGGLVLMPDASAGCVCSYLNQAWFALEADGIFPPKLSLPGSILSSEVQVTLTPRNSDEIIRFTLDGSLPTSTSAIYTSPITINQSSCLKARSFNAQGRSSRTVQAHYTF